MRRGLLLATRGSALALWQAHWVADKLKAAGVGVEIVVVKTTGDVRQDVPLTAMAGRGVFVKEIENALLSGEADIAVHSAKDLPSQDAPGLTLAAFGERADVRDALISRDGLPFMELPEGALIATSAPRRVAQLRHIRPDLRFTDIRGNVDTRLRKLADGAADALVLACAGLDRLGRSDAITERLAPNLCLSQVGQGAIAVQCREQDRTTRRLLRRIIDHAPTRHAVETERAFLALFGGGCSTPIAAHCTMHAETGMRRSLMALAARPDGSRVQSAMGEGASAAVVARRTFDHLIRYGGRGVLEWGNPTPTGRVE